ncbi:MAG TPA: serine hydrolase domain-containing protein, partial [Sedimentisphaerales bacterium]|nr:serine hydrolase domain-containing protein [Sedimentisphaerales bacterium]
MRSKHVVQIILLLSLCTITGCQPSATKLARKKLKAIDEIVAGEIGQGSFPGAVVLVGRGRKILYRRAFGNQMIIPREEAMNEDTVFDIASLTKPVATAASVMILRDRGKIKLNDYVRQYLPAFACEGKEEARIEHLL